MKNIHILPTDKPSRLFVDIDDNKLKITQPLSGEYMMNQNIYITSDEEIKDVRPHKGKWQLEKGEILNKFPNYLTDLSECKLVIMTTDPDLIADGVQAIDDDFLEWFVKNPSCESVKVERLDTFKKTNEVYVDEIAGGNYYEIIKQYEIIIPEEEPKCSCKVGEPYNNACCKVHGGVPQEEPKQETLEEAAYRLSAEKFEPKHIGFMLGVIEGAKLQAERMYSEEEVVELLYKRDLYLLNRDEEVELELPNEWFEQFKKK